MLALAKLGDPAIPAITAAVVPLVKAGDYKAVAGMGPLVEVLGSMGPAAVPALLEIAEASSVPYVTANALDQIAGMEPRAIVFGQFMSPWMFWHPADGRVDALQRALVPQLPRVRRLLERVRPFWTPESHTPDRMAAYLLARWGTGEVKARGLQVLQELAGANEPFYRNLLSIGLLHSLQDPNTSRLIRQIAAKVAEAPYMLDLKGQYALRLAIALHQRGDRDYASLLSVALSDSQAYTRIEAAQFVGASGELALAPMLLPLLDDQTAWNGRIVGQVALQSLQRLTLEQIGTDPAAWRAWLDANRQTARPALVARRIAAHVAAFPQTPMGDVERWLGQFDGSYGAAVFPLIDQYLERRNVEPDTGFGSGGGTGPTGMYGPPVVTLLLDLAQRQVPGALERLTASMSVTALRVRSFGALALAAFDRDRAVERLAIDAKSSDERVRYRASEFLLELGDVRGIPGRLELAVNPLPGLRAFACRDLRMYTQQTMPCDAFASDDDLRAWQAWWQREGSTFRLKAREAEIDRRAFPTISPISFVTTRVQ
jgi:HEAT repeat protein